MRTSKTHFDQVPVALVKKIAKEVVIAEIVKEEITTEEEPKRKGIRSGHRIVPSPPASAQSNSAGIGRHCRNGI
jgi:hypothetical protein